MIVDSHCHLDFSNLYDQLDNVIKRAELNQIKYFLTICTTLKSFEKIKIITNKYKNVYGTFGIHPHESKDFTHVNESFILKTQSQNKKIIGIGETGLDFFYNFSDKDIQKKSFIEHINAASKLNIPVIVHTRNAEKETYEILKSENKNSNLKILIHCFTGSKEFAKKLLDINCYISISGIITFNNSKDLTDTVAFIPTENLLVETDSPYLAPVPYRGKRCEPSYVKTIAEGIASIQNKNVSEVAALTTKTAVNFFNIPIF